MKMQPLLSKLTSVLTVKEIPMPQIGECDALCDLL
jgi:hypothetical protein